MPMSKLQANRRALSRRSFSLRSGAVLLALAVGAVCGVAPGRVPSSAFAGEAEQKKSVESEAVFFGDARNWSKPAEVDQDAVFAEISEYKEILDGKIEPSDPKYGVLMTKARKRFMHAVRAVAKDASYDLVAKVGSVKGVESVPVITQDVVAKL
ncbi:MAG: hypothetical protein K8T90_05405 [Planctomycetes bacterium]|nr:hypothetical protein [Planctomycetota bacterium]